MENDLGHCPPGTRPLPSVHCLPASHHRPPATAHYPPPTASCYFHSDQQHLSNHEAIRSDIDPKTIQPTSPGINRRVARARNETATRRRSRQNRKATSTG